MSDKITVKFKEAGKWADNPADPIFEVEEGEVREVSATLANLIVENKRGKIVKKKVVIEDEDKDPELKEGDVCTMEEGTKGTVKDGACVANEDDNAPKDGDACELDNGKTGVIKKGKCVKKGILG